MTERPIFSDATTPGNVIDSFRIGEAVYVDSVNDSPYIIGIIHKMCLDKRSNDFQVSIARFYRRANLTKKALRRLQQMASDDVDSHPHLASKNPREIFVARESPHMIISPSKIRGKCSVTYLSEFDSPSSFLERADAFFYALNYNVTKHSFNSLRKSSRVGSEYQAVIPEMKPDNLEQTLETLILPSDEINNSSTCHISCFAQMNPWTDDDADLFRNGINRHGKNFYKIHKEHLSWKTVKDLVEYYFFSKSTSVSTKPSSIPREGKAKVGAARDGQKEFSEAHISYLDSTASSDTDYYEVKHCESCKSYVRGMLHQCGMLFHFLCAPCRIHWKKYGILKA